MNILDFIYPKRCVGCGRLGGYICSRCQKQVSPIALNECICPVCERAAIGGVTHPKCRARYTPDGLTSFFYYSGVTRQVIKKIKYRFVFDMASTLVSLIPYPLLKLLPTAENQSSFLVPIPLHSVRFRYRGFNQAEKLGAVLATRVGLTLRSDILARIKVTPPQVEMRRKADRIRNMEGVFAVRPGTKKILVGNGMFLFDDVFTTGATMRVAANALKRAGARFVWCVTIAR